MTLKQFLIGGFNLTEIRIYDKQAVILYDGPLYLMLHNIGSSVDAVPYLIVNFKTWEQQQEILDSPIERWAVQDDIVHIYIGE